MIGIVEKFKGIRYGIRELRKISVNVKINIGVNGDYMLRLRFWELFWYLELLLWYLLL